MVLMNIFLTKQCAICEIAIEQLWLKTCMYLIQWDAMRTFKIASLHKINVFSKNAIQSDKVIFMVLKL